LAVPDYQSIMLPLLKIAGDGKDRTLTDAIEELATQFRLSENDRKEMLPSGMQPRFDNRVGWAKTYLGKAGLLESSGRGRFRITARGQHLLLEHPQRITAKSLERFPEYLEFKKSTRASAGAPSQSKLVDDEKPIQTPEELLEASYQNLRLQLAQDILHHVSRCSPKFFEKLVVDLLLAMGYGGSRLDAGQAVGRSNDGGIDGIIKEDKLGLDVVYIQAKRWEAQVGRPIVQAFVGSLEGQRARKGVLLTTSKFSNDARDYAERTEKRIVLIDGEQLAQLMIDHGVGVAEVASFTVKKIDSDYFSDTH